MRKREVFGWAMYDFANSGYTTVVLTAVFNAYFVGVVAGNAAWATLAWTSALALSSADRDADHALAGRLCRPARGQEAAAGVQHRRLRARHRRAGAGAGRATCGWRWLRSCCRTSSTPTASR